MPALVFITQTQNVAPEQIDSGDEIRPVRRSLHLANKHPRRGLRPDVNRFLGSLGQKIVMSRRPTQGLFQQRHRGSLDGRTIFRLRFDVPQHPVGLNRVVDIMRPLFAPLDFPGANLGHGAQHVGKDVQGQVPAGKIAPGLPRLDVLPSTGLDASSPETAFTAEKRTPITPAGHAVAKRTVHEDLHGEAVRASTGYDFYFVNRQLPWQNDSPHLRKTANL
ncbi:MAG: hypothetical protein P8Y74_14470, partial [Desulfobacterales bacterium]